MRILRRFVRDPSGCAKLSAVPCIHTAGMGGLEPPASSFGATAEALYPT